MFLHPLTLDGMPRLNKLLGHWPVLGPLPVTQPVEITVAEDLSPQTGAVVEAKAGQAQEHEWVGHCRERIEQFRTQSLSFKECGYTIREMAVELDIPQHHLSYVLNRVYDIRFNDFINEMRIRYLEERLVDPERLREMTLEGLSKEAGFTSRSTFIRAFHRLRGKNPSTYFKEKLA
jgi:AraC-like DNA-binding protein